MSKILKNTTTAQIDLDSGLSVPASGQITVNAQDFLDLANSNDIYSFIGSGDIVVNDGSTDLSITDAVGIIKSTFINLSDNSLVGPQGDAGPAGASGFGIYAFAKTQSDGTLDKVRGLTITKGSTGVYSYSFTTPTPDTFYSPVVALENVPNSTDTNAFITNKTVAGFTVTIGVGDNGTSPDTPIDVDHTISVLGEAGPQGITSAYESWLDIGNVGTEADFINSLASTVPGPQGPQGPPGDSQIRVSPNDSTVGFIEDKFVAENNKVSVTVINDGGDEDIQFGVNPGNIGTSELNNDANFINSAGAPVQPSDIVNFETTTQLNSRDTSNRNRANHTGTQTASTISDFTSAVQSSETATTLSFNSSTNILSYVNEDLTVTNIDLSLYLDNTNLAQIVSGTLDSGTGIATFTRDDSSTFTVDFSSLNDQAAINTAISTHETTIDNHDDVSNTTSQSGDLLRYDGSQWFKYNDYKVFIIDNTPAGTQSTAYQQRLRLNYNIPQAGNYKVSWFYTWSINSTSDDFIARVEINDSNTIVEQVQEAKDSAGTGITITNLTGGTFNTGTSQRHLESGFTILSLPTGSGFIDLDMRSSVANLEAAIYAATLSIERWS